MRGKRVKQLRKDHQKAFQAYWDNKNGGMALKVPPTFRRVKKDYQRQMGRV